MIAEVALAVSGVSLVLQGLTAARDAVREKRSTVRGLIALRANLDYWLLKAHDTNDQLAAWVEAVRAASDEESRLAVVNDPPAKYRRARTGQQAAEHSMREMTFAVPEMLNLFRVYAPDTTEPFDHAIQERDAWLDGLTAEFPAAYRRAGLAGLADLLTSADETLAGLRDAYEAVRVFIADRIPASALPAEVKSPADVKAYGHWFNE